MPDADVLFVDGPVFTADGARSWARAVAVRGDRVIAVGHDLRDLAGPRTEIVDLAGRLLVPGFVDAHVHPVQAGLTMGLCDLSGETTADGYLAAVARYAARHDGPWIVGAGWSFEAFPGGRPTRALLDAVVPDRPVYLGVRDGHSGWANSAALATAGVDADTPDPPDGRFERDADGTPTGLLHEGAMDAVAELAPPATDAERAAALDRAQAHLHALGITAWQDAIVGDFGSMADPYDVYVDAAADGRLTAQVVGALWWDRAAGLDQVDRLLARRAGVGVGRFRADRVKVMQDGIPENFTAAMREPYLDACGHPTGNRGLSMVEPGLLAEAVTRLDAEGFAVHFHAIGDRAVTECLDAVAAARSANGYRGTRHHLAHLQVLDPSDLPRFRALDVAATIQPLWAAHEPQMDELCIPFLGPERASRQYPFRALQHAGALLAMGSDWPVSSPDPLQGLHVAVNRIGPGTDEPAFLPEQRLDLATALAAYTAGSAWVSGFDEAGTIRRGAPADLVVLDRDPFAGPPEEIAAARVALTYVDGVRVHAADDA